MGEQNDRSPMKRDMTEVKENNEENKIENEPAEPNEHIENENVEHNEVTQEESNKKEEIPPETMICEEKIAKENANSIEFPFGDYIIEQVIKILKKLIFNLDIFFRLKMAIILH